jgi:hypothetical protein
MRSKGVWEGDFTTEFEGESTKLWISYTSGSIVAIEYTITNSDFGEISGNSMIHKNEMRVLVEKPV